MAGGTFFAPPRPPSRGAAGAGHPGAAFRCAVGGRGGGGLGNPEGTLSVGGSSKCGAGSTNCYAFQSPPSYAAWLKKAGFTVMNLANNHAFDYGASGQEQTLAALAKQRLATTGRAGEIAYQQVGLIKVALVGFAPYKWAQSLTNIPAAKALVKKAAADADVVIVTMHAGAEGSDHTHVVRGTEM